MTHLIRAYDRANLNHQSVCIPESNTPSGGWIRRNSILGSKPLLERFNENVTTVFENFRRAVTLFPTSPCFGFRPTKSEHDFESYKWLTYQEVYNEVRHVSCGLTVLGLRRQQTIGIWSKNCLPWMMIDLAATSRSLVTVAIYDTFGPNIVEYVLNHAEISVICCQTIPQVKTILSLMRKLPQLKHIILLASDVPSDLRFGAVRDYPESDLQIYSLSDIILMGKQNPGPMDPPDPEDLAVLMYTSGTTGVPKAVMQSHRNIMSMCASIQSYITIESADRYLSYLPLAHIFERCAMTVFLGAGASIGFSCGLITKLLDDISQLKPTVFIGVPRVFDRIVQGINEKVSQEHSFKRWLFNYAIKQKQQHGSSALWDWVVFNKIRQRLGGRVRLILSGGAPLSANTQEFIRICLCCPVLQGYGLTETCAGGTLGNPLDPTLGQVGPPILAAEIKLVDVPEMNYLTTHNPPTGEIWIRGPCVSKGYYKDPILTQQDFTDGWFHTGDIGRWNRDGTLSIIDRKKNIFKLSLGEYIAAEKLENIYGKSRFVNQIWIYGDSHRSSLVAIVVPQRHAIVEWAADHNLTGSVDELYRHPDVVQAVLDDLIQIGKDAKLPSFEFPHGLHLSVNDFTIDNDLVTPTLKLKRAALLRFYQETINRLYAEIETRRSNKT